MKRLWIKLVYLYTRFRYDKQTADVWLACNGLTILERR